MNSTAFYIKTFTVGTIILVISFILSDQIYQTVIDKNLLSFSVESSATIILLILSLMYTTAISVGVWNKWEQFIIICLPIFISMTTYSLTQEIKYGLIISFVLTLLIGWEVYHSSRMREILIKDKPMLFLKHTVRRIVFVYSLFAGIIYLFDETAQQEIDLGSQVAEMSQGYISQMIDSTTKAQLEAVNNTNNLNLIENLDPSLISKAYSNVLPSEKDIGVTIKSKVDEIIDPYEKYLVPLFSLSKFGIIQFYGIIAYAIYALTIDAVFWFCKKTGLLKVENVQVNKEFLRF